MLYGIDLCTVAGGPDQSQTAETLTISGSPADGLVRIALELDSVALVVYQDVAHITTEPQHPDPWVGLEDTTSVVFELERGWEKAGHGAVFVYVRVSDFTALVEADGIVWAHYTVDEWTLTRAYLPDRTGG